MGTEASKPINPWSLGVLLNLGCTVTILLDSALRMLSNQSSSPYLTHLPWASGSVLTLSALVLFLNLSFGRVLLLLSLLVTSVLSIRALLTEPTIAFLLLVALGLGSVAALTPKESNFIYGQTEIRDNRLLASLAMGVFFNWSLVYLFRLDGTQLVRYALLGSALICSVDIFRLRHRVAFKRTLISAALSVLVLMGLAWNFVFHSWLEFAGFATLLAPAFALYQLAQSTRVRAFLAQVFESLFVHAEGAVVLSFLFLCTISAIVLYNPLTMTRPLEFIDVAFTAVSAVCVTGLSTIDVGKDLTNIGRVLVLICIQLGGLGIMSLSSLAFFLLGDRLTLKQEKAFTNVYGDKVKGHMRSTLRLVTLTTFLVEGLGAFLLTLLFLHSGDSFGQALWRGIFTAVSAFCNAGFALTAENFLPYVSSPLILIITSLLIILGGVSPGFIFAVSRIRSWKKLSVQHKMIAVSTAALLVLGTFFFLLIEWDRAMAELSFGDKLSNAFFFSAVARTAGFNSLDMASLHPATLFAIMGLMFIGGSPGGTAGGIKVTTLGVLFATIVNTIKGQVFVTVFKRQLTSIVIHRALTVLLVAIITTFVASFSLLITQDLPPLDCFFEVVSALATVGLSTGITPQLDEIGKAIVMVCMFIGRIGPLAILLYLVEHQSRPTPQMPFEDVVVT